MPEADMTVPVSFWPLRTRAEMDLAAWEIFDQVPLSTAHTMRGRAAEDDNSEANVFLQVMSAAAVAVNAPYGSVLVKQGTVWEVVSVDQAAERGLPLPPLDED